MDALSSDVDVLLQLEEVIYPVLLHSLTVDGLDSIEEGIDCITILLHYCYKDRPISPRMWMLYPQLLYVCAGSEGEKSGGFGLEYVNQVIVALKNFVSRDQNALKGVIEGQEQSSLHLLFHFIRRVLEINRNGKDMCDGVSVLNLVIAVFENLLGQIDAEVPALLEILISELQFLETNKERISYKKYKGMVLQAFAMSFNYNAALTFQILEAQGHTLSVFQSWFVFMNDFKKDFEIRRVILGLSAIVCTQPLPTIVDQKLPDVMNQLSLLAIKMNSERLKIIKENETVIAHGGGSEEDDDFENAQ